MLTSKHYPDTLHDLETYWSIDDLYDALDLIETLDRLEAKANAPQK